MIITDHMARPDTVIGCLSGSLYCGTNQSVITCPLKILYRQSGKRPLQLLVEGHHPAWTRPNVTYCVIMPIAAPAALFVCHLASTPFLCSLFGPLFVHVSYYWLVLLVATNILFSLLGENLALGKATSQSSTYFSDFYSLTVEDCAASKAVDGNR